tara:strand:- start:46 stop:912 length:867 start_codon:yes stop_codon:yes gene_type:complete
MKILFIGVFDTDRKSTNTSQLLAFKSLGHNVVGYNYKEKALRVGEKERDKHLCETVKEYKFDLVVFSKCNFLSEDVFRAINKMTNTCLWFMDPLVSYDQVMRKRTGLVDYVCCDKENVLEEALKINKNSFHVCEGFDQDVDKVYDVEKEYDVSFIGNIYGDRSKIIKDINYDVKIINGVYGADHAREACKSRINLNFCTSNGASDRVYKILATGGFLLSNDWKNREKYFTDGKECVIFNDIEDLNKKIEYYLKNPDLRKEIASNGFNKVQRFNRNNWAENILKFQKEK